MVNTPRNTIAGDRDDVFKIQKAGLIDYSYFGSSWNVLINSAGCTLQETNMFSISGLRQALFELVEIINTFQPLPLFWADNRKNGGSKRHSDYDGIWDVCL